MSKEDVGSFTYHSLLLRDGFVTFANTSTREFGGTLDELRGLKEDAGVDGFMTHNLIRNKESKFRKTKDEIIINIRVTQLLAWI